MRAISTYFYLILLLFGINFSFGQYYDIQKLKSVERFFSKLPIYKGLTIVKVSI